MSTGFTGVVPKMQMPQIPQMQMPQIDPKYQLALIGFGVLIFVVVVVIVLYFTKPDLFATKEEQKANNNSRASKLGQQKKLTEDFTNLQVKKPQVRKLLNLQPPTVAQAGYAGGGLFDEDITIKNTLAAGVRSFVLQIDYLDVAKGEGFAAPGDPCLLYRDSNGVLLSQNSGSIKNVSEALAKYAFAGSTEPILLILSLKRTPDPVATPKDFLKYCSKIATQLKPLAPYHLGNGATDAAFHRQGKASDVLNLPFSRFEKKVIVMTNVDTSLFRKAASLKMKIEPADDLDYWSHVQISTEGTPAVTVPFSTVRSLKGSAQNKWALKNRKYFTVAQLDPSSNPSVDDASMLLNNLGINIVPIDIFSFNENDTVRLYALWKGVAWRSRPVPLTA
jgi:hypothetical protein